MIVFNQELSERALFHALVHTVQIQTLGLRRYAELWIRSFIKSRTHFTVPLEVHAFFSGVEGLTSLGGELFRRRSNSPLDRRQPLLALRPRRR